MTEGYKRQSHEHRQDLAGEYRWGDAVQNLFIIIFFIGIILDIFLLKISASLQNSFPWYFRIIAFIPLIFVALYFLQRSHKMVFKEERKKLMVINTDIFARVRHPMYFGSILIYLAFVVLSLSLVSLVLFILVVIFYYYICRYEENLLIEKLGDEYKNYKKKVPMLFPKIILR